MRDFTEEMTVARPPAEVWAALANFGDISRWAPNVDHSCLTTDQSQGLGTIRRVQMGRNTFLERVVDWEPDQRLGYTIEGLPPVIRSVTNTWRLDEVGVSTVITLTSRVDSGPRPPQQIVARVLGRVLAKASRQMLAGLNDHLEEVRV